MSKARTHGTRMSLKRKQQLGKRQAPVDLGVSAGWEFHEMALTTSPMPFLTDTFMNITTITNTPDDSKTYELPITSVINPEDSEHPEKPSTSVKEPRTPVEKPSTPEKPQTKAPLVKLGYLGIHEKPEESRPPMVYGKINGKVARIMLDSECSTYVLSTDFVQGGNIPYYSCKPVPVELAVRNAGQFNLDTQTKKLSMEVGPITQSKACYVLLLPGCDAIFGMPFLNGRKLTTNPEQNTVSLDDIELPVVKTPTSPSRSQLSLAVD